MRWKEELPETHDRYEKRIIKKFLWLPKCLNNEYRWLETTKIVQLWTPQHHLYALPKNKWEDYDWANG